MHKKPVSYDIDIASVFNGDGLCVGAVDHVSGTKITIDSSDVVTITAGESKTLTKNQAHTLLYCFMLVSGWDFENERTK